MRNPPQSTGSALPGEHLELLLARAHNPFEVGDELTARLATAVAYEVQLKSWRRHNSPPPQTECRTYRHTFTLSDRSHLVLWEVEHDTEADGRLAHELYTDPYSLRAAERRVHGRMGEQPELACESCAGSAAPVPHEPGAPLHPPPPAPLPVTRSCDGAADSDGGGDDRAGTPHDAQDSPDHARRLLRRARNADRPGQETLRLLSQARGHRIARAAQPLGTAGHRAFCSVYAHTFLLTGNREVTLFELEHDFTPGRLLVCEVYPDETSAGRAAELHALTYRAAGGTGE
ncbi:DUF6227 family protein [Streptomyces sp. 549]|uniref:DUF6227 family protein n=1 Tax=Streptomyces sp. 549 TaxID=3049076 RepID=UPI0024C2C4A9|nr:DUF6227 family protein [Streptomyces sp. 549]MDK1471986.1 DUF6227 family protein [Streptomyces sp. 549]